MKDNRIPTHVYLDIMKIKTGWNIGILAAADRLEAERTERAQAAPSQAPSRIAAQEPHERSGPSEAHRRGTAFDASEWN